jgi:hypothetical protein
MVEAVGAPSGPGPSPGAGPAVGVSCSGGGIRAASYALGCMQVLEENGVLRGPQRARYVSAVSGGSYAVGAMALIQKSIESAAPADAVLTQGAPYAQGSPELRRLRDHLGYLTHGPDGLKSDVWRALMGVAMNVALFTSAIAVLGFGGGWIYGRAFEQLRSWCGRPPNVACVTSVHPSTFTWAGAAVLGGLALVVGLIWVGHRWSSPVAFAWQQVSVALLLVAAAWALVGLGLPQVLAWLHRASLPHVDHTAHAASSGLRSYWVSAGGLAGIAGALAAVFGVAWRGLGTLASSDVVKAIAEQSFGRFRRFVLNFVTTLAVPALFGGLLIAFMHQGAEHSVLVPGTRGWEWLYVVVPLAFIVAIALFGDLNSWSLHAIYRARLSDAFNLERTRASRGGTASAVDGVDDVDAIPRIDPVPLSALRLQNFPEVLICATANIRNYGLVPTGAGAVPFLFSQDSVGGPIVGELYTPLYEAASLRSLRSLTVMDAVSISGAAIAPEMGKMTRAPLRFILALANIRLGVWIPKPSVARERSARRENQVRAELTAGDTPSRRVGVIKPPGLLYLLREAMGSTPERAQNVYVTDGGHYDNLGLVELLKRRCEWIWCIDASGDAIDSFTTLGQALAIAEAELGVTVEIEPRDMAPTTNAPTFVQTPFCHGTISYPAATPGGTPTTGTLVVVKAGVPADAPWAVGYYHASHAAFPCDTTLNQLYTADRFDAYLALGRWAMTRAFDEMSAAYRAVENRMVAAATT